MSNQQERIEVSQRELFNNFSLQEAEKKAEFYEHSPTALIKGTTREKLMNLRPREEEKELAGNF